MPHLLLAIGLSGMIASAGAALFQLKKDRQEQASRIALPVDAFSTLAKAAETMVVISRPAAHKPLKSAVRFLSPKKSAKKIVKRDKHHKKNRQQVAKR